MIIPEKSICFVIPNFVTFSTGGAEIQVHYLTKAFLERGWKVEVVCAGKGKEKEIEKSDFYNPDITYHYYQKRGFRFLEFFDALKALNKSSSNVYYQRTDFALTASCYWYSKKNNRNMVYALAIDTDAHKKKYQSMLKSFSYSSTLKKLIRKTDFLLLDKMIEWAKKGVKKVVFQNSYQQQKFKKNFGIDGIIIPNSFDAINENKQDKENVILWVGNDSPVKRPELFVQLADDLKEYNWRFVMMGGACDQIKHLSLPDNLEVLGSVSYTEANDWFTKAKIYVNTSSKEGMPNTFIQSWYYQTLVLSLDVDPDSVFTEKKAGLCFGDELQLLRAKLKEIIEGIDVSEYISCGSDYFKKQFDLNTNVEQLISFISAKS